MPGHEAWPVIEPYAHDVNPTAVPGRLYDTGAGYPAARFDDGATPIAGVAVMLDPLMLDAALAELDQYEGSEYRRIVVTDHHGALYAYEWIGGAEHLVELPSGSWSARS